MTARLAGLFFSAVFLNLGWLNPVSAAPPDSSNSTTLILTVKCPPSQRVALRRYMLDTGLSKLDKWKVERVLDGYLALFNRYVDNENWDLMLLISFRDAASLSRWRDLETQSPAVFPPELLSHVNSISTTPSDLVRGNSPIPDNQQAVFLVIPYDYTVSTSEYLRYVDGYVVPQLEGWQEQRVLSHYEFYLARYGASRSWSSLLILEYASEGALLSRSAAVAKVREKLKENQAWKAFADNKQSIRTEKQAVIADELRTVAH
jgi:hypothetical protein